MASVSGRGRLSDLDPQLRKNLFPVLVRTVMQDILGIEHDVESVLQLRNQREMGNGIPLRHIAERERFPENAFRHIQHAAKNLIVLFKIRHYISVIPRSAAVAAAGGNLLSDHCNILIEPAYHHETSGKRLTTICRR